MSTTTDGVEILHHMYGKEPGFYEMLAEERLTSQAGRALRKARRAAGLTLGKISALSGVEKCVIAQLEANGYDGHAILMLTRLAEAMNMRMEVQFVPIKAENPTEAIHAGKEAAVL